MLRGLVITLVYLGSLIAILFISAGSLNWIMGWASMGVYIFISLLSILLVDPELVEERSHLRVGVRARDLVLASLSFLFFFPVTLVVAGLDVGRFGWSPSYPAMVQLMALGVFALGNSLGCWAAVSNKFFSTFNRIQKDRLHVAITDGPYRYIRHPGYAGTIAAAIALPISLGSLWALIPAFVGACGFVIRTAIEDKTLMGELSGYQEYADEVRYRLIPGIW